MPRFSFTLNGEQVSVEAPGELALLYVLRDLLGVTGPKYGCGVGVCRACTSHLNGAEIQPCMVPVREVDGQAVTTIEGLADGDRLHPVQQAWLDQDVAQCGYCQPGQIMTAVALLRKNPNPTDQDIDKIENICRCGTYFRIREAIKQAARAAT
ncbi:MAG: (2Fe-2S)-binding protein [Pseudonocardiales bacterium]